MKLRPKLTALLLLLILTPSSFAPDLNKFTGRYRLAMEIELTPEQMKPLLPLFDWAAVEKELADGDVTLPRALDECYRGNKQRPLGMRDAQLQAEIALVFAVESVRVPRCS